MPMLGDDGSVNVLEAMTAGAEVSRLEADLHRMSADELATIGDAVERVRAVGDRALLGRSLCLLARSQVALGRHERAIVSADAALAAFATLDKAVARGLGGPHAESLRAAGSARMKLGRIAEALPLLEQAVWVAEESLADAPSTESPVTSVSAVSALLRGLNTLGLALFAVREIDTAIDVYVRALAIARSECYRSEISPDDVMLTLANFADAHLERSRRRQSAGDPDPAAQDLAAVRRLLDAGAALIADHASAAPHNAGQPVGLTAYARQAYYGTSGHFLLLNGAPAQALRMFERQLDEGSSGGGADHWVCGVAEGGLAGATLSLGLPADALRHTELALGFFDQHDETNDRARVLLIRSQAYRQLEDHERAYTALEEHTALRARLEASAGQQYASHMTARLGVERARAEAESHRRIAATLETLGRIGQEITANLDENEVFRVLHRHVGSLLHAPAFTVWLLDPMGERLSLAFGVEDGRILPCTEIPLDHPDSLAVRVVRERRELLDEAAPHARKTLLIRGSRPMLTALFAPLLVGERVLGVISIQSDRPQAYSENERSILRTLSTYGAIALDNAAAYRELRGALAALQVTQAELALRTAEFERLSMTDPLTGVANRRHLEERALIEIAEAQRRNQTLAVAMFDIDHFKSVNDTYGHVVGDLVLQRVAQLAKDVLRPADFIARVGGEEFALLLPGAGIFQAATIAERIRAAIAGTVVAAGDATVRVTSSFGVAGFENADTLDTALGRADLALYEAKATGRNRVTIQAMVPR